MPKLRRIDLYSLDEVINEIKRLRESGYETGGNWNLSQLCEHLNGTVRVGLDGSMKPFPWIMRVTLGNFMFWLFRNRYTRGFNGVKTLPDLEPSERESDDQATIDECLTTHMEARDRTDPLPPYPIASQPTVEQWQQMMTVHAQHHLEFLKPNE